MTEMLFNSNIYIYIFLPLVLIIYAISRIYAKKIDLSNYILLFSSLIFYAWGSGRYSIILFLSIIVNFILGKKIATSKKKKVYLIIGIVFNLGLLVFYKYMNFILTNIFSIASYIKQEDYSLPFQIFLPVGISFFSFQALSYLIDVFSGEVKCQKRLDRLALYIAFFPQLIAGPIVRYKEVEKEIAVRESLLDDIYFGGCRFCVGLAKKVLVADQLGKVVDKIFALNIGDLTMPLAWVGILFYSMQIYFDFSGYSDMAIGIARIFGFHFNENFNLPYISQNITEFWRRWHISLSSFFKDYLYIPLGGNRRGDICTYKNLIIVFALCGLWHGAAWNFILWGLYHGALLVIERLLKYKRKFILHGVWGQIITFFLVLFGWLVFRSDSLSSALDYARVMLGNSLSGISFQYYSFWYYVDVQVLLIFLLAMIISVFPFAKLRLYVKSKNNLCYGILALFSLAFSMLYLSGASFNSFIYFQF